MAVDRCTDTRPHSPHRAQYGPFGVKDCPGIPTTPQNAPEVPAGPAPASTAALFAEATRWRVLLPVGALKGIAETDARRLAVEHGGTVQRQTVRLYSDGTEVLSPWTEAFRG